MGMQVATVRAAENETNIMLPAKGVYLVKAGGFVTKVLLN